MAVATVVLSPTPFVGVVKFKYTCDASPSATNINLGFVPSLVVGWNVTAMNITTAAAAIASGRITPVAQTDCTNHGFQLGTDASVQEASKVFEGYAIR